jgi:ribosomal protein L37AE/L43A
LIAQRCPKCGSKRLRRGYTDTSLLLRLIGVYNLLCDNCNLLFRGFAVPGTVPAHGTHRRRHHEDRAAGSAGRSRR